MRATTMDYKVDDDAMLKKLKPGDEISVTLYEGDYTLYDIQVVQIDDRKRPRKGTDSGKRLGAKKGPRIFGCAITRTKLAHAGHKYAT